MSLADALSATERPTNGPKLTVDASTAGGEFAGLVTEAPIKPDEYEGAFAKVYELAGLNPADYRIVDDTVRFSTWEQSARGKNGDRDKIQLYAYRARFQRISKADALVEDIAPLLAIARANARRKPPTKASNRTRVVVPSDPQAGKVGSRGGTPALLGRLADLLAQLDDLMVREPCQDAVVLDPGDIAEGFENVASQRHTNDLSHPAQLRVARAITTDIVTGVASRHQRTRVAAVGSNHTAWRAGKDILGKPADDYGIDVHMAVQEALSRDPRFNTVEWTFPDEWDDSVAIDVRGAVIGLVHGHQVARPDAIPAWWKGQSHGSQAIAKATILITGHFHHFRAQPSGAIDGRSRYWFQAPTMDNGSDWYRNSTGEDSEPGLLTFTVDDEGRWDNLRVITASTSHNPEVLS